MLIEEEACSLLSIELHSSIDSVVLQVGPYYDLKVHIVTMLIIIIVEVSHALVPLLAWPNEPV